MGRVISLAVMTWLALVIVGVPVVSHATAAAEPAFRARHFDLRPLPWSELFPGRTRRPPYASRPPVDRAGLPMRRWTDGRLYYSPSALTFDGLRRLDAYVVHGERPYLDRVLAIATKLRSLAVWRDGAAWLPFPYDNARQGLRAPWYNALAQGTALALFARLYRLRGEAADLAFAEGLFRSLAQLRDGRGPWVGWVDRRGRVWYEHYPGGVRGKVLNAHAYVAIGLRDLWQETRRAEVRRLLEGSLTTLRERGDRYRRPGASSWYCLRNRVAHPAYHRFHIRQLRAIARASGDPWFEALADALARDVRVARARAEDRGGDGRRVGGVLARTTRRASGRGQQPAPLGTGVRDVQRVGPGRRPSRRPGCHGLWP